MLLLAFLKNTGFGKKGVSNFTKSFSVLSFFLFRGLKGPLLPCVREGREEGGHRQSHLCGAPTGNASKMTGVQTPLG